MKSGIRDKTEGKLHKVKGKVREIAGKVTRNSELEGTGKAENAAGRVQEKSGDAKKFTGRDAAAKNERQERGNSM